MSDDAVENESEAAYTQLAEEGSVKSEEHSEDDADEPLPSHDGLDRDINEIAALHALAHPELVVTADYNPHKAAVIHDFYEPLTRDTAVEVRYINELFGKGMFARRNVVAGEEMFKDVPVTLVQLNDHKTLACLQCMKYLSVQRRTKPIVHPPLPKFPCRQGCGKFFCSLDCEELAWNQHHCLLCDGAPDSRNPHAYNFAELARKHSGKAYFGMASRVIARLVTDYRRNGGDFAAAWRPFAFFRKDKWWNIQQTWQTEECAAMNHEEFIAHLKEICFGAAGILKDLCFEPGLEHIFTGDFFATILGMFDLNCLGLMVPSPHDDEKDEDYNQFAEGVALCVVQSTANHSCVPNGLNRLAKNQGAYIGTLSTVSLREITAGEDITISYLEENAMTYKQRRKKLLVYKFLCTCARCVVQD